MAGLRILPDALIPGGNKPLIPWSPVPAVLNCAHDNNRPGYGRVCCCLSSRHYADAGHRADRLDHVLIMSSRPGEGTLLIDVGVVSDGGQCVSATADAQPAQRNIAAW